VRIDDITNADVEAVRYIKNTALATVDIAVDTAVKLNEQGEKLENIASDLQGIDVDITAAKYDASKLQCCGCWYRCCNKRTASTQPMSEFSTPYYSAPEETVTIQPKSKGPFIKPVLNDAREMQMEDDLQ